MTTIYRALTLTIDGIEDDFEVEITYTYRPGDPGRLWDLPENCYPPEPAEIELEAVIDLATGDDLAAILTDDDIRTIKDEIEESENQGPDDYDDYDDNEDW